MYCCSCSIAPRHADKLCDKFHKETSQIHFRLQVLFDLPPFRPLHYRAGVDGNPPLIEIIRREIDQRAGRITFERFMELALYHPQHGYYTSGKARISSTAIAAVLPIK